MRRPAAAVGLLVALAACGTPASTTTPTPSVAASTPGAVTATPATPSVGPLAGRVVVLDPGHNGGRNQAVLNARVNAGNGVWKACNTTGTSTATGYPEHSQVYDVALRTAEVLRSRGATVVLTRTNDTADGPCITERAAVGNRVHAAAVVSIHDDGNPSPGARGFHVIRSPRMAGGTAAQDASARLATAVRDAFAHATAMPRSSYLGGGTGFSVRTDLGGLNLSRVPAVMVEAGNMRQADDAALLASPAFRQREAVGLADGLQAFLTVG